MGRWFLSVGLLFVIVLSFISISEAFHTDQGGHAGITTEAANLKEQVHNKPEFRAWLTGSGGDVPALQFFQFGAHDEDSTLPWDTWYGDKMWTGGWLNHFYGPTLGMGLFFSGSSTAPQAADR